MTFPVVGSNIPGSYEISNSLRFNDGDTPYLTRSTGTTNKRTFTVSVWAKRSTTGARQTLWSSDNNTNDTGDGTKGGSGNYISFWNNGEFMFGGFGGSFQIRGDGLQRDIAGWYHIVAQTDTTQATTNDRGKLWINGVQQTTYTSMIGQNIDVKWATNRIGVRSDQANYSDPTFFTAYMDGYLAELHVVDGQALTASDFGEYDEDSGIWKPKQYAGTYGTDGYYLKFNNSGNMGEDSSGNDNTFTPTNLSGTTDVTTDTPTNNFATMNPLAVTTAGTATFSEGNCQVATVVSGSMGGYSTLEIPSSGVWYCEAKITTSGVTNAYIGLVPYSATDSNSFVNGNSVFYYGDGSKYVNGSNSAYGTGWSQNDIIGIKVDADSSTVEFYLNGTSQGSISHSVANMHFNCGDTNPSVSHTFQWNFGSPVYSISSGNSDANGYGNFEYSPSGGLALCTQNLATALSPTIDDGSQYFNTVLYSGNNTAKSITGVGFQPDFIWDKNRSDVYNHYLNDSSRGVTKYLNSNNSSGESTITQGITSFDSDGFSVGTDNSHNANGTNLVAWNWKANGGTTSSNTDGSITSTVQANTTAGFSIVTYTGNGTAGATIGHGLGVTPSMFIIKGRSLSGSWVTYHKDLGATKALALQGTNAPTTSSAYFNNTEPTSSVITLGYDGPGNEVNNGGDTYVAYCFAEIEGYSKFGSYTGNGSSDGTFIYTGFRPAFVICKRTNGIGSWVVQDNKRPAYNQGGNYVYANALNVEATDLPIDILSNGFKQRQGAYSDNNGSGDTYIYMAFAENPFVTSGATPVTAR